MHTRNTEIDIDFEDASKCWRENKKFNGTSFSYICVQIVNGKTCGKNIWKEQTCRKCFKDMHKKFQ